LAEICASTFVDLWNSIHFKKLLKFSSRLRVISWKRWLKFLHFANQQLSKSTKNTIK
jgi:hypothetical protein